MQWCRLVTFVILFVVVHFNSALFSYRFTKEPTDIV